MFREADETKTWLCTKTEGEKGGGPWEGGSGPVRGAPTNEKSLVDYFNKERNPRVI